MNQRSPTIATLLSLVVPGLGHFYLGRFVPGLGLLAAHVALGSIATIAAILGLPSVESLVFAAAPWCLLWVIGAVWANRSAQHIPPSAALNEYQRGYLYVLVGLLALPNALAWTLAVRERVAELFFIPSSSMRPGIASGSRVLVNKLVYRRHPIRRGDPVVFTNPNARYSKYVKRVVALPGDRVEMQNDELIVNGQRLEYTDVETTGPGRQRVERRGDIGYPIALLPMDPGNQTTTDFAPLTIPNGHCFVLGDNRHQSEDSRTHGPVPLRDVVGRVEWVF